MLKMTSSVRLVKKRLVEWGLWSYQTETTGLSYSGESIFTKLAKEQGLLTVHSTHFHEQVQEMDALIEQMRSAKPNNEERMNWCKVIRIHYTRFQEPAPLKIQLSHFSKAAYYRYLNDAEEWLAEKLYV